MRHYSRWHRLGIPTAVAAGLVLAAAPAWADPAPSPTAAESTPAAPTTPSPPSTSAAPTTPASPTASATLAAPIPPTTPAAPTVPAVPGTVLCDDACAKQIQAIINNRLNALWGDLFGLLGNLAPPVTITLGGVPALPPVAIPRPTVQPGLIPGTP